MQYRHCFSGASRIESQLTKIDLVHLAWPVSRQSMSSILADDYKGTVPCTWEKQISSTSRVNAGGLGVCAADSQPSETVEYGERGAAADFDWETAQPCQPGGLCAGSMP